MMSLLFRSGKETTATAQTFSTSTVANNEQLNMLIDA
jgi:hypothetical protein